MNKHNTRGDGGGDGNGNGRRKDITSGEARADAIDAVDAIEAADSLSCWKSKHESKQRRRYNKTSVAVILASLGLLGVLLSVQQDGEQSTQGTFLSSVVLRTRTVSPTSSQFLSPIAFPQWNDPRGIFIDDLIAFMLASSRKLASTIGPPPSTMVGDVDTAAAADADYYKKTRLRFPEVPYILDRDGLWVGFTIRKRTWKSMITPRVLPTEWLMRDAYKLYLSKWKPQEQPQQLINENATTNDSSTIESEHLYHNGEMSFRPSKRWPAIWRALFGDPIDVKSGNSTTAHGIPFLVWYGDYKGCNYHNWGNRSIPLFTMAAAVSVPLSLSQTISCRHAFPMPNYKLYQLAAGTPLVPTAITTTQVNQTLSNATNTTSQGREPNNTNVEYDLHLLQQQAYAQQYRWKDKLPQAVWRGSLTAIRERLQHVRWKLVAMANYQNDDDDDDAVSTTLNATALLDVRLVKKPSFAYHNIYSNESAINVDINWTEVLAPRMKQVDFQRYMAIIDVDGNSWSSRLAELLCYNSVILKVEPNFVEYYYSALQPWVHYIPVRSDLSDLLQRVAYAVHPDNTETIQAIIANANAFCAAKLRRATLAADFLDVLEEYTRHIDRHNMDWNAQRWQPYKSVIMEHHEAFDMRRVE